MLSIQTTGGVLTNDTLAAITQPTWKAADALTAHAGGGQTSALSLAAAVHRASVVTTLADSFVLPAGVAGQVIVLVNSGANPCQVFGLNLDTINDVAAATGVAQMPNSIESFYCTTTAQLGVPGKWYVDIGTGYAAGLVTDSYTDGITAHSGGTQAAGYQLTSTISRITTVAAAGDSVLLPLAAGGLDVLVINHGANAMQVFGAGTDTIDDVATATGVSQMANSVVLYMSTLAGKWYSEGLATGYGGSGLQTLSFTPAITAHSGGTQALAVNLTSMINRVSVVAAQGDSVALPASAVGLEITVINRGANPCQVFGNNTAADTINGIATATGISQGIGTAAVYVCNVAGNWEVPITALVSTTPALLSTITPAIPPHVAHAYMITYAGVCAATLAAPTATTDDGIEITVTSTTAHAHTITTSALFVSGSASTSVFTFPGSAGGSVTLMAYQAKWYPVAIVVGTFTS